MKRGTRKWKMKPIDLVHGKTAPIVKSLARLEGVRAILCFGSYAMGTFDEYSDLDLFAFCEPEVVFRIGEAASFRRGPRCDPF